MSAQSQPSPDELARDSVPADSGAVVFPERPEIAAEMKQLDFLLGEFRVEYTNLTTEQVTTGSATCTTRPVADGRFYEMTQRVAVPAPGIVASYLLGWSAVDQAFTSFYYDDWGHHGTLTGPGWDDGHFKIAGDTAVFGMRHRFVDDYEVIDGDHFVKHGYIDVDGQLVPGDILHFHRS